MNLLTINLHYIKDLTNLSKTFDGKFVIGLTIIFILMLIDDITGFVKAQRNHSFSSSKGYTGLLKNLSMILLLIIAIPIVALISPQLIAVLWYAYIQYMLVITYSIAENLYQAGYSEEYKLITAILNKLGSKLTKEDENDDPTKDNFQQK